MSKIKILALVLAGALPATVGTAGAFGAFNHGGHGHGPGHGKSELMGVLARWHVDQELDALGASPDQRRQIHEIEERVLGKIETLHRSGGQQHAELLAAFEQDTPDRQKIHDLVDAHVAALKAFAHEATDAALDAHAVLDPGQRQKLVAHLCKHHKEKKD